jgi:hypothetical protein
MTNGQDYWLWLAYSQIYMSVCYFISREKGLFLSIISFSSRLGKNMGNKKANPYRWRSLVYNDACK